MEEGGKVNTGHDGRREKGRWTQREGGELVLNVLEKAIIVERMELRKKGGKGSE